MATVARAALRPGLSMKPWPLMLPLQSPFIRLASNVPDPENNTPIKKKPRLGVKRLVPEEVRRFVPFGRLLTTRENRDFLLKHDLEPDHGTMTKFAAGPELKRLIGEYNLTVAYSPKHIIHPYDLLFFEPRGHPLAPMKRTIYLRRTLEQPLWFFVTCYGGAGAVVRKFVQKRLKGAVLQTLETLGYNCYGIGEGKEIRGTLWITVHNPIKTVNLPAERFGKVFAEALAKQHGRRTR